MSKSLFIGRYQSFHAGHATLINSVLNEGGKVAIAMRDTPTSEETSATQTRNSQKITKTIEIFIGF
jgi:nicotinamide mononucleotide adenylyltransferase